MSSPAPSSAISMTMLPPSCEALQRSVACAGLPAAARRSRDSMPWSTLLRTMCISGSLMSSTTLRSSSVSSPVQHQLDVLAGLLAEVADQPRHLLERLADRHHAHRHRVALQVAGDALQLRQAAAEALVGGRARGPGPRPGSRLRDHELADHVDQVVQLAGVDLDRARRLAGAAGPAPACRRRGRARRAGAAMAMGSASGSASAATVALLPPAISASTASISASRRAVIEDGGRSPRDPAAPAS